MIELVQQLALLDGLLSNWDAIRAKMGPVSTAGEQALAKIAVRLSAAQSPGDVARAVDDLLELVEETPAHDYVRQLLVRSQLGAEGAGRVRSYLAMAPILTEDVTRVQERVMATGQTLGRTAGAEVEPYPVPVFFATNRKADKTQSAEGRFSGDPADINTLGLATVTIPIAKHKTGRVETPAWWNRFADKKDASRYVVLRDVQSFGRTAFCAELGRAVTDGGRGSLLVFVHGYNVTFDEAARRAAQFAYDIDFHGAVVLFSWPSLGTTFGYLADEDRATLSAARFVEFLQILEGGPWKQTHLVAHSMGNRVVLFGLADNPLPAVPVGQIVFVAADIYVEIFEQKFPKIRDIGKLKTSYASTTDRALLLSWTLHRAPRLGITDGEPITRPGMETIDASAVDTSLLGLRHSYFTDKPTVIADLASLLQDGRSAAWRDLERPSGKDYWQLKR